MSLILSKFSSFFLQMVILVTSFTFLGLSISGIQEVYAQSNQSVYLDKIVPVQLDLKLLKEETKVIGSPVVSASNSGYTSVETTFTAEARAFGGDIYLPAYIEDIVSRPLFESPKQGSNAVVPGTPSLTILKELPKVNDKYLLKEYDTATIQVKISFKVLPTAMPARLSFAPVLSSLVWYPVSYEGGVFDPGIDPLTGERISETPFVQPVSILQQVTRVDWRGSTVVLWGGEQISELAEHITRVQLPKFGLFKNNGSDTTSSWYSNTAQVIGALRQIFQSK